MGKILDYLNDLLDAIVPPARPDPKPIPVRVNDRPRTPPGPPRR
ncbi:MAG: hypothetical protein AAGC92_15970 [Pseudomonadota bacterium]